MSERLTAFLKTVTEFADAECSELEYKAQKFKDENIILYRKNAEQKNKEYIQYETNRILNNVNSRISSYEAEKKSDLISLRTSIADKVFDEVRTKLEKFTQSDEYEAFLIKSAKELHNEMGESTIIFIGEKDVDFTQKIKNCVNCEIRVDNEITIGGLRATDKDGLVMADDTLDARFNEAQKNFMANSDLKIF